MTYSHKKNVLVDEDMTRGVTILSYYKMKSGKLVSFANFIDDEASGEVSIPTYKFNGKEISEEKYRNLMQKYQKAYKLTSIEYYDEYSFTESNINKYVK